MISNQQICSRPQVQGIVAELRQLVRRIQLPSSEIDENPRHYCEVYTEEVTNWVDSCMNFVRMLARDQGVRFRAVDIDRSSAPGGLIRYLGACDALLGGLESAVGECDAEVAAIPDHSNPWPLKRSVVLMDEFRRVLLTTPLYMYLKAEGEGSAGDGSRVMIRWVRSCAVHMESWASGMGFRSTIPIPELSDDGERVLGALDTWLSMLQQAFNEHLQPEYA